LGGNLVLTKASCTECQTITGSVEQRVLRRIFDSVRTALGLQSQHSVKRKLPPKRHIDLAYKIGTREIIRPHPVELLPPYGVPSFVTNCSPTIFFPGVPRIVTISDSVARPRDYDIRKLAASGQSNFPVGPINWTNRELYTKMLMKIALAYAVSAYGVDHIEAFSAEYISQENVRPVDTRLVGSFPDNNELFSLHDIMVDTGKSTNPNDHNVYVVVTMKLFSYLKTPIFQIVVGRLIPDPVAP
jgi:hypothetical protein